MNKILRAVLSVFVGIGAALGSFIVFLFISLIIWSGENEVVASWYTVLLFLSPLPIGTICALLFFKKYSKKRNVSSVQQNLSVPVTAALKIAPKASEPKKYIPATQNAQMEMSKRKITNMEQYLSAAYRCTDVSTFISSYDKAVSEITYLLDFKKLPSLNINRIIAKHTELNSEFQLHLCDAIVRAKGKTISDIKGKFRNSCEFQEKAVLEYENDLNNAKTRFNSRTMDLASKSVAELRKLVGLSISTAEFFVSSSDNTVNVKESYSDIDTALATIDIMEGHDFEYWCANALRNCGFYNVEVTPGSGDQGVDIICFKDGVKYAVQCKRYNSDLGNTPVQEVFSGKAFYHCHVGAVMTNRYITSGAKQLAKETGTLLWDRDWIIEHLKQHLDLL